MKPTKSLLFLTLWLAGLLVLRGQEPRVIPLWEKGAPGFEDRRNEPEVIKGTSVQNIHNPSITVFPAPKEKANGAAVLLEVRKGLMSGATVTGTFAPHPRAWPPYSGVDAASGA